MVNRRPGAFLDVGANSGQTLADFLSTGSTAAYIGFEPNVRCLAFVTELVSASALGNVTLVSVGLWNEPKMQELLLQAGSAIDQTATVRSDLRPSSRRCREWIWTQRLDDVLIELGTPAVSLVKIDVEGAELEVIEGMTGLLARAAPPIICEVLPADVSADLESYRHRVQRLAALLHSHSYVLYRISVSSQGAFRSLQPIDVFPIACWTNAHANASDYLFVPAGYDLTGLPLSAPSVSSD